MFGRLLGGSLQGGFRERHTRAHTLAEHESALQKLTAKLGEWKNMTFVRPPPLDSCSSVRVADLEPGWTPRTVLRGRLVTHAIKMQSVQSVLEDEAGDVVTLTIYNVPSLPAYTNTLEDLQAAQALFPKGQRLAVVDPFFYVMQGGTHGVWVDNPAEVLFLDDDGHPSGSAAGDSRLVDKEVAEPDDLPDDLRDMLFLPLKLLAEGATPEEVEQELSEALRRLEKAFRSQGLPADFVDGMDDSGPRALPGPNTNRRYTSKKKTPGKQQRKRR